MKRAVLRSLTHPLVVRAAFPMAQGVASIFFLHRFRDRDLGNPGHDVDLLRENLAWLRAHRCTVLPLNELLDRLESGAPINRTVAFTIDDGYADFSRVAAPVFAEFDCPVTVFLTTGLADGNWMWWDKVTIALEALGRAAEADNLCAALKAMPDTEMVAQIDSLVRQAGVDTSQVSPARFAPMTWDDARRLGRQGVTFGPHTITHPILSQVDAQRSTFEITESWRRVQREVPDAAIPIFCYPNGSPVDFGAREERTVEEIGMRAAVTIGPGYVSHRDFGKDVATSRFRLARFWYADDRTSMVQIVCGLERAKMAVRAAIGLG